ncbi:MAG: DNA primase [Bacillota bacterium]|jgi:DNA primase|nr:DNA primase [Bacillota bacterium]
MGLSDNVIDEIKSRCNIVDVIGRVVSLKKTGSNHKGLCPFHNEKTPSFVVSEDKQIFTCFGCGVTGDVIEFTQRYNNLDFRGAIEKLAGEYGIDLGSNVFPGESQKTQLYEINREAAAYFYRCFTERANRGAAYMQSRGLEPSVLRKFGIGYADDGWQSLYDFLKSKGYEDKVLLNLGLVAKSKDRIYDKFRDRVMFPIINTRGKVVGFGGRAIGDGMPKYLNSQESLIFQKKNNLFGLNLTRQDINREDCAILVEGYMDVITMYQHGVRNVSASLGTALTENQAAMLKRYTKNIVLAYDGDEAGQSAALRGMDILYAAGCSVKVLQLPDGKDPDEFIRKNGRDAFLERIEQALPFMDFKLQHIKKQVDLNTTEGSVTFLKEAARALRLLSPVEAETYIKKVASETGISEGAFRLEVFGSGYGIVPKRQATKSEQRKGHGDGGTMLERNLIGLMLLKSSYLPLIEPYKNAFETAACSRIFETIRSLYKPDEEIDLRKLADSLDEEANAILTNISETVHFADRDDQVFEECIAHIQATELMRREEELIKILSILDDEKDRNMILKLSKELMDIQKERCKGTRNEL